MELRNVLHFSENKTELKDKSTNYQTNHFSCSISISKQPVPKFVHLTQSTILRQQLIYKETELY